MKLGEGREETGDGRADELEESRTQGKVSERQVEGPGERLGHMPGAFKKRDVWLYMEDPEETGLGGEDVWGLGVFSSYQPRLTL